MALEELLCRLLGALLQRGVVARLADDFYIRANTVAELIVIWDEVLDILNKAGMGLSPKKTFICPQ